MRVCLLVLIMASLMMCVGCISGSGFHKKATLMPDELSISADGNPQKGMECDEITIGVKWKLK